MLVAGFDGHPTPGQAQAALKARQVRAVLVGGRRRETSMTDEVLHAGGWV